MKLTFCQLLRSDIEGPGKELKGLFRGQSATRALVVPITEANRRLKVVTLLIQGSQYQAVLDSGGLPKMISFRLLQRLAVIVETNCKKITAANAATS